MGKSQLERILEKASRELPLDRQEIVDLLDLTSEEEFNKVTEVARKLRGKYFFNKIFLYGFIYFSTYCRNDCTFCLYRKSNSKYPRYRKSQDEIMATAHCLGQSGVNLLDLTMGEDPLYHSRIQGFNDLIQIVKDIKRKKGIPVMISPGVVSEEILLKLKEAGADWYACYQETHNKTLYSQLRIKQSYEERMNRKMRAQKMGYLIEEGLLTGVGETSEDIADSILTMRKMGADQVRVMSFVPQKNTPLENWKVRSHFRELLIIAIMRLVMPDRLIPASLDVDGLRGLVQRLNAGANVITSIIPPSAGMAGVSQSTLDIEDGNRSLEKIIPLLGANHLEPATLSEYQAWVQSRQAMISILKKEGIQCG